MAEIFCFLVAVFWFVCGLFLGVFCTRLTRKWNNPMPSDDSRPVAVICRWSMVGLSRVLRRRWQDWGLSIPVCEIALAVGCRAGLKNCSSSRLNLRADRTIGTF